jgi:hypothetical protein
VEGSRGKTARRREHATQRKREADLSATSSERDRAGGGGKESQSMGLKTERIGRASHKNQKLNTGGGAVSRATAACCNNNRTRRKATLFRANPSATSEMRLDGGGARLR